jgi:hypothetical protein
MSNLFRAVTIDVEGNAEAVQWDTTTGTLTHLQRAVDGLVDLVALHEKVTMWVNDEGNVKGMPMNIVATSIARGFGFTHQAYFGPVVFTGGGDEEGETLGLSEQHAEALVNLARLAQLQLA